MLVQGQRIGKAVGGSTGGVLPFFVEIRLGEVHQQGASCSAGQRRTLEKGKNYKDKPKKFRPCFILICLFWLEGF